MEAGLTPAALRDARAQGLTLRERLADVARFVARPTFARQPMAWGRVAAWALVVVFAFDLALDGLASWLIATWDEQGAFLPDPVVQDISLTEDMFSALLLAPVLEEALFRGWMTGRIAALRFALFGLAALAMFAAGLVLAPAWSAWLGLAGLVLTFAGLIQWSRTRDADMGVPAWFPRHFHWLVWGQAVLFGLIHLGNYEPLAHPLGVLVVVPQTIGGLLLAYVRTRIGLGAAMAHHAAYNALFLAGDYGWW